MPPDLTQRLKDALARPGPVRTVGGPVYRVFWKVREAVVPSRRRERRADRAFDEAFGTTTTGLINRRKLGIKSDNLRFAHAYAPVRPAAFAEVMDLVEIDFESSVFVDFGSGMGRALLLASDYPFRRIVGVELSPLLHEIALGNIEVYSSPAQRCASIESVLIDAAVYPIPEEPGVLFFFNPFEEALLREVAGKIAASLERAPRDLYILYVNPSRPGAFTAPPFELVASHSRYAVFRSDGAHR